MLNIVDVTEPVGLLGLHMPSGLGLQSINSFFSKGVKLCHCLTFEINIPQEVHFLVN